MYVLFHTVDNVANTVKIRNCPVITMLRLVEIIHAFKQSIIENQSQLKVLRLWRNHRVNCL